MRTFYLSISIILILSSGFFLSGCLDGFGVNGSGNVITVNRETKPFESVTLNGKGNLFITQDSKTSLRIEAEDNIIDIIYTRFQGDHLEIGFDDRVGKTKPIRIFLTSPNYKNISVNGAGNIMTKNVIKSNKLTLSVSGAGKIDAEVDAKLLRCDISGAGDVELSGRALEHKFSISGAGELDAYGLITDASKIDISGAGSCKVNVSENLKVEISGAGSVYYKGSPEILEKDISGAGSLKQVH